MKSLYIEKDFSEIAIKGRQSMGNIVTKNEIHKISLKEKGGSTLGGRQVWFDWDVLRLNYDGRGEFLGEFHGNDQILVVLQNGDYYTSSFDAGNHYETNILLIEKYDANKVWTAVLNDADQGYPYLKRFQFEQGNKKQNFLGENPESALILLSDEAFPRFEVIFGGHDAFREPLIIEASDFIAVKGFKAKGKRISTYNIETVNELEPTRHAPEKPENTEDSGNGEVSDTGSVEPGDSDLLDEINGQMKLFD